MSRSVIMPTRRSSWPTGIAPASSCAMLQAASQMLSSGLATRTSRLMASLTRMNASFVSIQVTGAIDMPVRADRSESCSAIPMRLRLLLFLVALPFAAIAAAPGLHPEEAYPDNIPPMVSPGPFTEFIKQVQEKLHQHGFDAGPINGDFGPKTQAALAQFQLSR